MSERKRTPKQGIHKARTRRSSRRAELRKTISQSDDKLWQTKGKSPPQMVLNKYRRQKQAARQAGQVIKRDALKLGYYRGVNNFPALWLVPNHSSLPRKVRPVRLSGRRVCQGNTWGWELSTQRCRGMNAFATPSNTQPAVLGVPYLPPMSLSQALRTASAAREERGDQKSQETEDPLSFFRCISMQGRHHAWWAASSPHWAEWVTPLTAPALRVLAHCITLAPQHKYTGVPPWQARGRSSPVWLIHI